MGSIGDSDPAVRMHGRIVRRVEWFAVEPVGEHGTGPIMLVADGRPIAVLSGEPATFSARG